MPQPEDLAARLNTDNTNTWFWLGSDNDRIAIFSRLLNLEIMPQPEDLAARLNTDNTNTWFWLGSDNDRIAIFSRLLNLEIMPQPEDLAARRISDNTNTWFWLASDKDRIAIFSRLLDRGITPKRDDLNTRTSDGSDCWTYIKANSKTKNKLEKIFAIFNTYQLADVQPMASLILRADFKDLYAFLYILNLYPKNTLHPNATLDIYNIIGKFILPNYFTPIQLRNFRTEDNRTQFTKYFLIYEISRHISKSFFANVSRQHSLLKAVRSASTANELHEIITHEIIMARNPGLKLRTANATLHSLQPYNKKSANSDMMTLLKDACALLPPLHTKAIYNPRLFKQTTQPSATIEAPTQGLNVIP